MAYYVIAGNQGSLSTSGKSAITTNAPTSSIRRHKVAEFVVGAVANPNGTTDTSLTWDLVRITATGSVTSFTPNPQDPADLATPGTAAGVNATTEPTTTANSQLAYIPINQRNTVRWVAVQESQMHIVGAVASAGVALRALAATGGFTGSVGSHMIFLE